MKPLLLYTTAGCHLCELAEAMLNALSDEGLIKWHAVEISDSEELVESYGVRIPVVGTEEKSVELGWPFSADQLRQWVVQIYS